MRPVILLLSIVWSCTQVTGQADSSLTSLNIKSCGIQINVTSMEKAVDFYVDKLGFEILSKEQYPAMVELKARGSAGRLVLNLVKNLVSEGENDSKAGLTLRVNDFDTAFSRLKKLGVDFGTEVKRKEGVGYAIHFFDPFGTKLSLMHVTVGPPERIIEPQIYNYGIEIPDMEKARSFFKQLGFLERSQRYLPLDMPLGHADKTFGFMLHERENVEALHYNTANDEHIVILFKTPNIDNAVQKMNRAGVKIIHRTIQKGYLGRFVSFRDPFGLVYQLIEEK